MDRKEFTDALPYPISGLDTIDNDIFNDILDMYNSDKDKDVIRMYESIFYVTKKHPQYVYITDHAATIIETVCEEKRTQKKKEYRSGLDKTSLTLSNPIVLSYTVLGNHIYTLSDIYCYRIENEFLVINDENLADIMANIDRHKKLQEDVYANGMSLQEKNIAKVDQIYGFCKEMDENNKVKLTNLQNQIHNHITSFESSEVFKELKVYDKEEINDLFEKYLRIASLDDQDLASADYKYRQLISLIKKMTEVYCDLTGSLLDSGKTLLDGSITILRPVLNKCILNHESNMLNITKEGMNNIIDSAK